MRDTSAELEQWTKRCIYRLPTHVTDQDNNSYKPQVVSIGPYHHGEPHLKPMDDHKHHALLHFLKRSEKPFHLYVEALAQVVQELKDAYDQLDPVWQDDTNAFLKMMVLDGCFILEILRMDTADYAPNDPLFSEHGHLYMLPFLRKDMFCLRIRSGNCLHLFDVYRKSLLHGDPRRSSKRRRGKPSHGDAYGLIPSASELQDAGIRFKKSKSSLSEISFHGKTLGLPKLIVDAHTKSMLLNLIAFERFHVGAGNEVISYVFFLYNLIRSPTDVRILSSQGIISNYLGSDLEVAILFNLVSRYVTVDPESSLDTVYLLVSEKLRNRFTTTLNEWQADFIRTYFKSPWAAISVVAPILYFGLTIIQTTCSVLSYIHRN
ncbi:UNVERIFIED_CONTAM: hypothetical protein Sradi_1786000 [Sesamum radiatum]|uniref:Uncharacterized protein n=1 Tax=Sesamum radiatum TaxID=300843 RepID=A0AAW2TUA3_SESRA